MTSNDSMDGGHSRDSHDGIQSERGAKTHDPQKQDTAAARSSPLTKANGDALPREKTLETTTVLSINDRKVKLGVDSDSTSLYTLCRRWLRNDTPRKDQPSLQNFAKLLPKPLPANNISKEDVLLEDTESEKTLENYLEGELEAPNDQELLENHITRFKNVRKRLREQHKQRIERYKLRLALLLQPSPYQDKVDASPHH